MTSGAPTATAGKFIPGAIIQNAITGILYSNTGSTASPVWSVLETSASGFTLPIAETDAATDTGTSFSLTFSALTSGKGENLIGPGAALLTGGIIRQVTMGAATVGAGDVITNTGAYIGTGIRKIIADAATTGIIDFISAHGLTTGIVQQLEGGGVNMLAAGTISYLKMGAATTGIAQLIETTGIYTNSGLRVILAPSATSGILDLISGAGITSGVLSKALAAAATMTTGRYYQAHDGATEVFGIGANGHIHSTASAVPPTILITAAHGITAVALTAGASDTCGIITSTGTQDNVTDSTFTLTFGKTYTVAPKSIQLTAMNAAGAVGTSQPYLVSISATAAVFGVSKSAGAGATPSWCYTIIA